MPRLHTLSVAAALLVSFLVGCAPEEKTPVTCVALEIHATTAEIPVGRTQRFSALATYSDGSTRLVTPDAEWTSRSPDVAAIAAEGAPGSIRAVREGDAVIVARFDHELAELPVKAAPHALDGLRIEEDVTGVIPKGASRQLRAMGVYSDGANLDVTGLATWTTDSDVATVDAETAGLVTGAAEGDANVVATLEGERAQTAVTVTAAQVAKLEVDPPALKLAHGTSAQVTATAIFTDGTVSDVTLAADWTSGDAKVAAFDDGAIEAVSPGTGMLTLSYGGADAMLPVTVTPAVLSELSVSPSVAVMPRGTRTKFSVSGKFTDGTVQDLGAQASWSTSDADVADFTTTTKNGEVFAMAEGACELHVTVGDHSASAQVTVTAAQLVALSVALPGGSVAAGNGVQAKAIGTYTDGSSVELTSQVAWSSSDPSIAAVDGKGWVTGVAPGAATIGATFQGQWPSAAITVTAPTLNALTLAGETALLPKGGTFLLTAQGSYSDGHAEDVSAAVVWSSSNPFVAAVSNAPATRGTVTGLSEGISTITATVGGVSISTTTQITAAVVDHLEISPGGVSLPVGLTATLSATQVYSDGSRVVLGGLATWSTSSPNVADVDVRGKVIALGEGTAVISVTDGGHSASIFVQVTPAVVTSVTLSQDTLSLPLGTGEALVATAHWSDGTSQNVTSAAQWTSSDATVVSVSNGGIVGSVAEGRAIVTATWNGFFAQADVVVTPAAIVGLELSPSGAVVSVGQSLPLTAIATYTDGHTEDVSMQANWVSTSPSTASVVQTVNGWTVVGNAAGGAEVRAYLNGFVASAFFTVQ